MMDNAKKVDALIADLRGKLAEKQISLSDAIWTVALACVGWPYVFGAWGAECTVAERKKRLGLNPTHTSIRTSCKAYSGGSCSGCKWYPEGERVRCFDCRGFTDWLLKQFGFDLIGEGATGQWITASNWIAKGSVKDGIPQGVIVCLFYESSSDPSRMAHTGIGFNGQTCECSSGVQHFEKMKSKWTKWAIPACFADSYQAPSIPAGEGPEKPSDPAPDKLDYPILRRSDKGEKVRLMQSLLSDRGFDLGKYGIDGDFGSATEAALRSFQRSAGLTVDGVCGPKTWAALLDAAKPILYTVTIPGLPASVADDIIKKYGGSKVEE